MWSEEEEEEEEKESQNESQNDTTKQNIQIIMKIGLSFENEDMALEGVREWCIQASCPLAKQRYEKPGVDKEGK